MFKKLLPILVYLNGAVFGSESTWQRTEMPPLLPKGTIIEDAVLIPEFGYHATKNVSNTTVILTPLSPCVGVRVCNANNREECVDLHMHPTSSLRALQKAIDENITSPNNIHKKDIELILFTRTNEHEFSTCRFTEGNHAKRVEKIIETIEKSYNTVKKTVYYNKTADTLDQNDRSIIYMGHTLYRVDPYMQGYIKNGYKMTLYVEKKMWDMVGFNLYSLSPWNIWQSVDVPLYGIKKNNLKKINALPAPIEHALQKYRNPTLTQKICFYSLASGSAIFTGIAVGALIHVFFSCREKNHNHTYIGTF